ncbi:prepilin-type N-terminal cleavage/methylation domain-containing protein [Candidatus Parcubacteria bacterium]|nr:prepilin-type N-terminal cleavage/methylation domain-containing protein [Candidatus Parcubacteria bacterium]
MRNHFHSKGFTIIETIVAISIVVIIIMGATKAVQRGLSLYIFSKDQITGFYLAQEGFEQIRNIRDENRINGRNWLAGIANASSDPCYFGQSCTVSPVETQAAIRCSALGSCPALGQDASGFYGYNAAWAVTPFTREISLSPISADEMAVTVTVSWSKGGSARQFQARENILNW